MTSTGFDVAHFTRHPHDLRRSSDDPPTGLPQSTLRALSYLWSIERTALDRLRELLVTPAHSDSRLTAFLITWSFEQHQLSERLRDILVAHDVPPRAPTPTGAGRLRRVWDERGAAPVGAFRSNVLGADLAAAALAHSWLDTTATALLHESLGATEPGLAELSVGVCAVKARHREFFTTEVAAALTTSGIGAHSEECRGVARARRYTRRALSQWRWPGTRYAGTLPAHVAVGHLLEERSFHVAAAAAEVQFGTLIGAPGVRTLTRERNRILGKRFR